MNFRTVRKQFLSFFEGKQHKIVASAPIVSKDDPTLLFTNAGMNQFKDLFLDNKSIEYPRIADTQKCLRVSGKHNDLEEVGVDTYHHTMFEMLGNWSFGDYFKEEAIDWAWELLTDVYKIDPRKIYVTVFEGDKKDNLPLDSKAKEFWEKYLPTERILECGKKDNFWEMGEIGPCGPCSEIHLDLRSDKDRAKTPGHTLVNEDHPEVVEIWNLVFMQFNRKVDRSLELLPKNHVDTGMGFERLCMALQNVTSTYDTDIFQPLIRKVEAETGHKYGSTTQTDIAIRVIVDHIRAVVFAISDGQLPSSNGAGYVVRRVLRRAVRYAYSTLNYKSPLLFQLIPVLIDQYSDVFPELGKKRDFLETVIKEEELSFLRTIDSGLKKFDQLKGQKTISGNTAFELYDTYGFPLDLTLLIAKENGQTVDEVGFASEMEKQKNRSKSASSLSTSDWVSIHDNLSSQFVGYDNFSTNAKIVKYRSQKSKKGEQYQIVFEQTPFYPEGGGQVGDTGAIVFHNSEIRVFDTKKENDLILHYTNEIPQDCSGNFTLNIDQTARISTCANHSATHLLHESLRQHLGTHVEQRGSLVNPDHLRFDFSHFSKVTDEQLKEIEKDVNQKIIAQISLQENRAITFDDAIEQGAMALFGEKYGDLVRMIKFNSSVELCGGTHVSNTSEISIFKIKQETAVAAGIRRIEAVTGYGAYQYMSQEIETLQEIKHLLKGGNPIKSIQKLLVDNKQLSKQIDQFEKERINQIQKELLQETSSHNDYFFVVKQIDGVSSEVLKQLAFNIANQKENTILVLASSYDGKAFVTILIDKNIAQNELQANVLLKTIFPLIEGGGGGQPFFATAGGKNGQGVTEALESLKQSLEQIL